VLTIVLLELNARHTGLITNFWNVFVKFFSVTIMHDNTLQGHQIDKQHM